MSGGFRLSRPARRDLDQIILYLAERNPDAAERLTDQLFDRFDLLGQFPKVGDAQEELGHGMRRFTVGVYVVYFFATVSGVEISRVVHGARSLSSLDD